MKKLIFLISFFIFLPFPGAALAQTDPYAVNDFSSNITINKDSSVTIEEKIEVTFNEQRHGIFRVIPVIYRADGRVINSKLQVLSVNDKFDVNREGDNISIKIGDGDKYVSGKKTYLIKYRVRNIIQRFEDYDELYWNIAGDNWDAPILSAQAKITSDFATIENIQCFEGIVGADSKCESLAYNGNTANFASGGQLGNGRDMTIVLGLNKNNNLTFTASLADRFNDYWAYAVAVLPLIVVFYFWFKKGRDERFVGDNVYYEPAKAKTETTPIFGKREFLPMVYSPINGLTPAEVGTLIDERVDIHDVVAEITELGRLGYIKIEKISKRFAKDDYLIKKLKETDSKLRDYQIYLYESIFSFGDTENQVKLSELKKKFYVKLEKFREKLYAYVESQQYFFDRPDQVRTKWFVFIGIIDIIGLVATIFFSDVTGDFKPIMVLVVVSVLTAFFAFQMPRKTARGYALYRQTKGLAFYLDKGRWREEIKEKQLFLDEILPLAIALGVVKKLARDMEELGVKEPSYFNAGGVAWASSINSFSSSASSNLAMGASGSSSGWSGGSGFSGGSSGGGFGGGGGGSW